MSVYNMLFGVNSMAGMLLDILELAEDKVPRFRDCFLIKVDDKLQIVIHTRTGGGNREFYDGPNGEHPEGPWNSDLRGNPHYLYDMDDKFDCTYANFYFSVPEKYIFLFEEMNDADFAKIPEEKWKILFEVMKKQSKEK